MVFAAFILQNVRNHENRYRVENSLLAEFLRILWLVLWAGFHGKYASMILQNTEVFTVEPHIIYCRILQFIL